MTEPDYYKILGVAPDCDVSEIRRAYRRKARHAHPDAGGDPEAFHLLQAAYDALSDTQLRLEHDAIHNFKSRAWRRAPGRHAKRRVKAWRVKAAAPTGTARPDVAHSSPGDMVSRPWFIDIDPARRLRYAPSLWRYGLLAAAASSVWCLLTWNLVFGVLNGDGAHTALKAFVIPYALGAAAGVALASTRPLRHRRPTAAVVAVVVAALGMWISDLSFNGVLLAAHVMLSVALPWCIRRLRSAARIHRAVRSTLNEYNAFGPAGARPSADRRTGAVLRTLLERLPAARLFVQVPAGASRADYTIVCGRRVAVITPPLPRSVDDAGAEALPDAVDDVKRLLGDVQVRGFVVWPHLPVERISGADALVRHLSAPEAAGEIGRWLADDPYTMHLPTLRRLRDRLAAGAGTPRQRASAHV